MKSAVAKRSVVIGGHKTSISLEEPFWRSLREIAGLRRIALSALLQQIDLARRDNGNLSSAVRLFVLDYYRERARVAGERPSGRFPFGNPVQPR